MAKRDGAGKCRRVCAQRNRNRGGAGAGLAMANRGRALAAMVRQLLELSLYSTSRADRIWPSDRSFEWRTFGTRVRSVVERSSRTANSDGTRVRPGSTPITDGCWSRAERDAACITEETQRGWMPMLARWYLRPDARAGPSGMARRSAPRGGIGRPAVGGALTGKFPAKRGMAAPGRLFRPRASRCNERSVWPRSESRSCIPGKSWSSARPAVSDARSACSPASRPRNKPPPPR